MEKIKLSFCVFFIIILSLLLTFHAAAVLEYKSEVLTAETQKGSITNFVLEYDTLFDNLKKNAKAYINTGNESYKEEFYSLYNNYINNDTIESKYSLFTPNQADEEYKELLATKGSALSTQIEYLNFNKSERLTYYAFLFHYNKLLDQLALAVDTKDMSIITSPQFDQLFETQGYYWVNLSRAYIERTNYNEDKVIENQNSLLFSLVVISVLLLSFCALAFYTLFRKNRLILYFMQLYNTVVENVNVGIAILGSDWSLIYMNPMYKKILDLDGVSSIGKPLSSLFDSEISELIISAIKKSSTYSSGEIDINIGSQKKHISYSYFLITDADGNKKYVNIIQDYTSIENMQAQQKAHLKEIEFYSSAKDSFIANISHEIKTPINAIMGLVHILKGTRLSNKQKDLVRKIETSSDILFAIISDVLDISKIKSGLLKLYPTDFSLIQVIKNVEDMFSNQISNKGLKWYTDFDFGPNLCVHLDKTRFFQVLVNLINNAYKFTDKGHIRLEVKTIFENSKTVFLQFCIEDTGMGISEEDIPRLFKEFEQLENHLTKQHQGTGLGLFICKNIIESMGGKIWVESVKDEGSKFYFTLKAEKAYDPALLKSISGVINSISLDINDGRALVVEDTEINAEVTVKLLNDINVSCDIASDGLGAIKICKNKAPDYYDVILMDIHMPVMDGYEAAYILKNKMGIKSAIIALTASDISDQVRKEQKGIIKGFIFKPFKAEAFYKYLSPYFLHTESGIMGSSKYENIDTFENEAFSDVDFELPEDVNLDQEHPFAGRDEAIKNLGGLDAIYYKHVDKFKLNYAGSTKNIVELLADNKYDEARRLAHSLKGLAGTLGMTHLQAASAALEEVILEGNESDLSSKLEEFEKQLDAVIRAI